ncbi:nodulate formation efficiency C protein [Nitrobacter sp. NHB1]|uniref:nodulate formation efficiency C protein n=1 Tax=Nitrobacter sp. NHB1 TaxID=3119830 RepID=UPI002FFE2096
MFHRWSLLFATFAIIGAICGRAYAEEDVLIKRVKTTWRAQDGATTDDILSHATKVAHFVPRGWGVGQKHDSEDPVFLSWSRSQSDKPDDEHTITWDISASGVMSLGPAYAKTMELGWRPFALSLIAREVADHYPEPDVTFLRDTSNYDFVATAQGGLGDLLKKGRCTIGNPVSLEYVVLPDEASKDDLWRLQLSVNCKITGPSYFTRDGIIIFKKKNRDAWQPASFFAHRIAKYPAGHWFEQEEPDEKRTFDAVRKALKGTR